jgi:hypothetical protein
VSNWKDGALNRYKTETVKPNTEIGANPGQIRPPTH